MSESERCPPEPTWTVDADAPDRPLSFPATTITVLVPTPANGSEPVSLTILEERDDFEVVQAPVPVAVRDHLETVDCVVLPCADAGAVPIADILEREPGLPIVVVPPEELARAGGTGRDDGSDGRTPSDPTVVERIRRAVGRRRSAAVAGRALHVLETASDGLAIVTPDGRFAFVNRTYARRFGYDPSVLPGRPWTNLFTDDAVEHLLRNAIPTVEDGWRWTGTTTGRRQDGESLTVTAALTDLGDGWLGITVLEAGETVESS